MTTGYAYMSPSMLWNWEFPWVGWERAPSVGLCPWLPIIALTGTNHNLCGHLSSVAQWRPQTRWSPQVYKFSCLNLIHNFVHILLFLRDNFNYIQKSEKANESQLLLLLSLQSCPTDSVRSHRWQPTRLPCPWDSPGKNTGMGCHFLLQCMKVKSESEVAKSFWLLATPWTAAYQAPLSMAFSRQEYWSGLPLSSPWVTVPNPKPC